MKLVQQNACLGPRDDVDVGTDADGGQDAVHTAEAEHEVEAVLPVRQHGHVDHRPVRGLAVEAVHALREQQRVNA